MNRNETYEQQLSQRLLKSPKQTKHFLFALMEGDDGMSLEAALKHTIYRMGVKEFAKLAKVHAPHVTAFLRGKRTPKPETLNTYLAPFGLRIRYELEEVA
ncbi:MAG: helix-turn-helix domain-containing protein [Bacteriovoracia bacterium]